MQSLKPHPYVPTEKLKSKSIEKVFLSHLFFSSFPVRGPLSLPVDEVWAPPSAAAANLALSSHLKGGLF